MWETVAILTMAAACAAFIFGVGLASVNHAQRKAEARRPEMHQPTTNVPSATVNPSELAAHGVSPVPSSEANRNKMTPVGT